MIWNLNSISKLFPYPTEYIFKHAHHRGAILEVFEWSEPLLAATLTKMGQKKSKFLEK